MNQYNPHKSITCTIDGKTIYNDTDMDVVVAFAQSIYNQ